MLCLTRKVGERIIITIPPNYTGGEIVVNVCDVYKPRAADAKTKPRTKLGFIAHESIRIVREEIFRGVLNLPPNITQ